MPLGPPRRERADAVRNRVLLLRCAREMLAEDGPERITMDELAERSGLGKGTVFRRFGTRAGIFRALLDDDERVFQQRVLEGPPPLGPGAMPGERLIAYGRARIAFIMDHLVIARAALDRNQPVPAGDASITRMHLRVLLEQAGVDMPHLDSLAVQLTGAIEGPMLLYLATPEASQSPPPEAGRHLADSWQALVKRLLAGAPNAAEP